MREIVFDTETTGLSPLNGDRLVEIGCVELINRVETGRTFHAYFNPGRPMPTEAQMVHGLSDAFLSDKPLFPERCEELLSADAAAKAREAAADTAPITVVVRPPRPHVPSAEEIERHAAFVATLVDPIWARLEASR